MKIIYSTDSLVIAVIVAVSTTVLALVAIGLGIRHFAKMRLDKREYEVEPLTPEGSLDDPTGDVVVYDVSVNNGAPDS